MVCPEKQRQVMREKMERKKFLSTMQFLSFLRIGLMIDVPRERQPTGFLSFTTNKLRTGLTYFRDLHNKSECGAMRRRIPVLVILITKPISPLLLLCYS